MLGQRIRQARVASELTMRELAQHVGVSHTAISKYESGKTCPRPSVLLQIARTLNVKMEFFFQEQSIQLSPASQRGLPQYKREAIEARIKSSLERYFEVEGLMPPDRQVSFRGPKYSVKHVEEVEDIAEDLRYKWELGFRSIDNLTSALEEQGIVVLMFSRIPDQIHGYSCWANETIPVAVCKKNLPGDLQRQILGYELAHLILDIDNTLDQEKVANRFATAFLAPRRGVFNKIGIRRKSLDLDELCILKQEYKISMHALARRALDLGIVSQERYRCICNAFRKLSFQGQEPGEEVDTERPLRFPLLVRQAVAEGFISHGKAAALLEERENRELEICCEKLKQLADSFAKEYMEDDELTIFTRLCGEDFYSHE
jgi:Zn-dependent peptidase ImmA (M78 family)/DNA-binding XRE family transcriptional regulator